MKYLLSLLIVAFSGQMTNSPSIKDVFNTAGRQEEILKQVVKSPHQNSYIKWEVDEIVISWYYAYGPNGEVIEIHPRGKMIIKGPFDLSGNVKYVSPFEKRVDINEAVLIKRESK